MTDFTDDQRVEMIENQCEHIISLCETYVEGDTLEDVGNIRALYEEYRGVVGHLQRRGGCS